MPGRNSLLACIEPDVLAAVRTRLSQVQVERGQVLHTVGEEVAQVYFPIGALIALGVETVAGEGVNVSVLGAEGAIGVFEACGSRHAYTRATVQIGGAAWRLPAPAYRELFSESAALRTAVHRYVELLLAEARQFVACNALHTVENRLARILLEVSDRIQAKPVPITQDALSQLLGVQRTTVAAGISALQKQGLIRGGRGAIEILEVDRLEQAACSCRETLRFAREDLQSRDISACEAQ